MLNDMLKDPETPRWRVWLAILDDAGNMMGGGVKVGVLFGLVILAAVFAHGALGAAGHYGFPELAIVVVALAFVAAGFVGARRSGFVRGIGAGVVAGVVSTLSFPIYAAFSGRDWWASEMFAGIILIASAEGLTLVAIGATLATLPDIVRRVRRSARAFAGAWIAG